jgi:ribosomal protein S18 acetylase RimI-like enzyme
MSQVQVRPFRRADREQLTSLVNAHIQAVVPGVSVSVNTVLSQLERDPGEFIVDPWVAERMTLVAEQRGRVVAAAHLLRYGAGEEVGESMRGAGGINWLLYWPEASYWPDSRAAADALMTACLGQLGRWRVTRWYADGTLPAPGVYGLPEQWPHIRALYERAGFIHDGHTEIVLLARVDELPGPSGPPIPGLRLGRALGVNGTRLYGSLGGKLVGYIEVETNLAEGCRLAHLDGWADVGNLHVDEAYRRRGVATWLVGQAADWLRLARIDRLLDYAWPEEEPMLALLRRLGFRELTQTDRGWVRLPDPAAEPGPPRPSART